MVESSIEGEPATVFPNATRGLAFAVMELRPVSNHQTMCTYAVEIDPKGYLPHFAVDLGADDVVLAVASLRDEAERLAAKLTKGGT